MKFIRKIIHLMKAPDYSPPLEYEPTYKEKLIDLIEDYKLIEKVKEDIVDKDDKRIQKRLEHNLLWLKEKIIKLAIKI